MATEIAVSKESLFCGCTRHSAAASPGSTLFSVSRLWKSSLCLIVGVTETLWLDRLQSLECGFSLWPQYLWPHSQMYEQFIMMHIFLS